MTLRKSFLAGVDDLAGCRSFYAFAVGFGDLTSGEAGGRVAAHLLQCLGDPGRAYYVDADATGEVQGGGADKSLQSGIHEAHGGAAGGRIAAQNAAGQGDAAALGEVGQGDAGYVDLAHELVGKAELEVLVGELSHRLPCGRTGGGDDGIDGADFAEQGFDGCLVGDIDAVVAAGAAGSDDVVVAGEGVRDGLSDGA